MAKKASTINGKTFVMPEGTFVFPHLNTPDNYEGSVKYKCKLSVPADEAAEFIAQVEEFAASAGGELGKKLAKRPWDDDEKTEGNILFDTKCGGEYAPALWDASGKKKVSREIPIFGGTSGKLRVQLVAYAGFGGGVSLRLKAAQIINLKSMDSGFDAEEGYEAEDIEDTVVEPTMVDDTMDEGDEGEPNF